MSRPKRLNIREAALAKLLSEYALTGKPLSGIKGVDAMSLMKAAGYNPTSEKYAKVYVSQKLGQEVIQQKVFEEQGKLLESYGINRDYLMDSFKHILSARPVVTSEVFYKAVIGSLQAHGIDLHPERESTKKDTTVTIILNTEVKRPASEETLLKKSAEAINVTSVEVPVEKIVVDEVKQIA
jgi:hypothetical protein